MVPADETQARVPYTRVNHNKYMVTERATYIGECPERRRGRGTEGGPGSTTGPDSLDPRSL